MPFADAPTTVDVINELMRSKARAGKADDYLRNLRVHLRKFAQAVDNAPLRDIPMQRIESWIDRLKVNVRTRKGYLDSVRLLFNFAMTRGYVRTNPARAVELPPDAGLLKPAEIHTPLQVARVLVTTRRDDVNMMRFLAVRYFAGLRASEAQRCIIQAERGFIEVPSAVAKTRRRRLVKIQPVLAAWLALGGVLPLRDLNPPASRASARRRASRGRAM